MSSDKIKLIYLVSAPYSGSTLVSWLLGSHPDIATAGELSGPDPKIPRHEHKCSCGANTANCPFWQEITNKLATKGITHTILDQNKRWTVSNRLLHHILTRPFSFPGVHFIQRQILIKLPPFRSRIATYLSQNISLIKEITNYYNAHMFLDTSKDIDRAQLLGLSSELDIYIVHLVRDGRGQTCSKLERGFSMESACRSLVNFDQRAQALCSVVGKNHYIVIRYEDICQKPIQELSKVIKLTGRHRTFSEDYFSKMDSHVLGNPMRLEFTGKVDEDLKWRTDLTQDDLKLFQKLAGKRNESFGYRS